MLGRDLCAELCRDYVVEGTDIASAERPDVKFYYSDITDPASVAGVVSAAMPNFVIHTAAWTDVDGCEGDVEKAFLVNARGAGNAAAACKAAGAVLIYVSTDFVFDGRKGAPYKETDGASPLSAYGASKLKGEELVREALKEHFILRTSWLYGRHGRNFVDTIIAKATSGASRSALKVVDDQVGSPTYTKDLARAVKALLDKISAPGKIRPKYGIYNVSNSGKVSWFGYAGEILRLAGLKTRVVPISSDELGRPAARPAMSALDNSKFVKYTGHKMRAWKAALGEYLGEGVKEGRRQKQKATEKRC
jgi:dTDP-4-dehydrorhamnose reductase